MSSKRQYEIRLFDRTLVEFSIEDGAFGPQVTLGDYDSGASNLFPPGIALSGEGVWRWLESRSIPSNRKNAARICAELGFALGDIEALYQTSLGLSLNDSYWVVPRGFSGTFEDYNLFDNGFSEAIGALAVSGIAPNLPQKGNTPELSTDGNLRKGWRIIDGQRMLYKGKSDGFEPGEPYSEYFASLVLSGLDINAVPYSLDTWEGELCSVCSNFATKDVSYVPFAVATGQTDLVGVLHYAYKMGGVAFEEVCDMLALDALLCNTDRHLTNFGIMRDNATGNVVGLAPIFDNGRALFPNVAENDPKHFMVEANYSAPAFGGTSFAELFGRVAGQQQLELIGTAADRGLIGNVLADSERAAAVDMFIREHGNALRDNTKPVDHDELVDALCKVVEAREPAGDGIVRLEP